MKTTESMEINEGRGKLRKMQQTLGLNKFDGQQVDLRKQK